MRRAEERVGVWVELVDDLLTRPTSTFPRQLLSAQLHETFQCQVAWNWLDGPGCSGFVCHIPMPGWPPPEIQSAMVAAIDQHPLIRWFAETGDLGAMTIGRVPRALVSARGYAAVRDFLAPVEMNEQLSIPYRFDAHHRAFVMARGGEDFSGEDLRVARQIQPLLQLLDRHYRSMRRDARSNGPSSGLTGRELAVLHLLADGCTASVIGSRLVISPRTVHRHLHGIYRKLGAADRVRAVLVAQEAGLLGDRTEPDAGQLTAAQPNLAGLSGIFEAGTIPEL